MDHIGGRAPWTDSPYEHVAMRQPHIPKPSSVLSANAAVFIPRSQPNVNQDIPHQAIYFHPQQQQTHMTPHLTSQITAHFLHNNHQQPQQQPGQLPHLHRQQQPPHLQQQMHPSQQQMHPSQQQHQQHQMPMQHHQQHHNTPPHMYQQQPQHHGSHHQQPQQQQLPHHGNHHQQPSSSRSGNSGGGGGRSVQNRLNVGGGGGGGGPVGYQQQNQQHHNQHDNESSTPQNETELHSLDFLSEVIKESNSNPGVFEDFQHDLMEIFMDFAQNHFVMSNAVEIIFEQSVKEQNFRYTGARLCRVLDSIHSSNNLFRTLLCQKMMYHDEELKSFMLCNEKRKVRGTALFLAELYMQLQNDGNRMVDIAHCIIHSLNMLLKNSGPENVKCVCQTLKLCGYELELDCQREIGDIINILTETEHNFDVSTGRLIRSVLDLRAIRWGRNESIVLQAIMNPVHYDYSDEPVFYGPDGQVMTEEENNFLCSNMPSTFNCDEYQGNDADDLVDAEDEMDPEIQLAFKDFVKSSKSKQ